MKIEFIETEKRIDISECNYSAVEIYKDGKSVVIS
jgi:hypothetical protein